ncbi:MAG: DAK2 domain-containing protein [Faecousia sp.]
MEPTQMLDGVLFANMVRAGAMCLGNHAQAINSLNVFPIPDGDTGTNMMMTITGGVDALTEDTENLGQAARKVCDGMLLSARGNSGVILSQLFAGIAEGFKSMDKADAAQLGKAMLCGVEQAYRAVLDPKDGTILTVARCAGEYAAGRGAQNLEGYLDDYLAQAKRTLEQTPDMLPVLKNAGVVDSGGAGLICIVEGMRLAVRNEAEPAAYRPFAQQPETQALNLDLFSEDSILEYGYCTEFLLRLQRCKCDVENFDVGLITDYLEKVGDSVVAFKTGSIVKIHVHTRTPDKVLGFCQLYGEFLKIKIENMSLQHNNTAPAQAEAPAKEYGVVAVCSGDGIKQLFMERGADVIVDGGQSMNPSTEDFLAAFRQVNAKTILVFPNNGNVILSAKQAAALYSDAEVRVIESKTIGEGYSALSMFVPNADSVEQLVKDLTDAMDGVVSAEISRSVRDADYDGTHIHAGDYIGISGKNLLSKAERRPDALAATAEKLNFSAHDICLLIYGAAVDEAEAAQAKEALASDYPGKEVYLIDGRQEVYDYILILE